MTRRPLNPGASPMHYFGSEVRRAREKAGMTGAELGELVPCDKATVSRIETGLLQPDEAFAVACDTAFPHLDGWFTRYLTAHRTWGDGFPEEFAEFAVYEREAAELRTFDHALFPGLLQTEDYARAVLERHPNVTRELVTERVTARLARQSVLSRDDPPLVWVLVDEPVLHRDVGDAKTMHDQLSHVAGMARRPNITVQLIPRGGAHVGLQGAFTIADTPDGRVAYLEHITDGLTTGDPSIVTEASVRFDSLRTEALRGSESLILIEQVAEQWNQP